MCKIYGTTVKHVVKFSLYKRENWNRIRNWMDEKVERNNLSSAVLSEANIEAGLHKITDIMKKSYQFILVFKSQFWQKKLSRLTLYLIGQRNKYRRKLQRCNIASKINQIIYILKQLTLFIDYHIQNDKNNS